MLGFTIIRTKELESLKKKVKVLECRHECGELFILNDDKKRREKEDIELRKWCVEKGMSCRGCDVGEYAELIYRYVTTGDIAIFAELKEFREWKKKKKDDAKASQSHLEAQ